MDRVHPAAFSLLLSLPILPLSICLWAETHGTSCSTQPTSQKFTSCSSALLFHTSPIPRTCINSTSYARTATGTNKQASECFLFPIGAQTCCLSCTLRQWSSYWNLHIPQKCSAIISVFPPAQIWSDGENTLCYFNGEARKRRGQIFI